MEILAGVLLFGSLAAVFGVIAVLIIATAYEVLTGRDLLEFW
jgi:hypothetical protein